MRNPTNATTTMRMTTVTRREKVKRCARTRPDFRGFALLDRRADDEIVGELTHPAVALYSSAMRFWIEDVGAGASVLCISGLGYSNWCWRETADALSRRYRVITFDNRGTGRSDVPE